MQDIHTVIRRKQTQYAQLGKEIELLQQAEAKLREVAPLLADADDEESSVLAEVEEEVSQKPVIAMKVAAASVASHAFAGNPAEPANPVRPMAPRWP
jgi:hypothetical protein